MKRPLIISLVLLTSILSLNAQILTPSAIIQGPSGDIHKVGIGYATAGPFPNTFLHVSTSTGNVAEWITSNQPNTYADLWFFNNYPIQTNYGGIGIDLTGNNLRIVSNAGGTLANGDGITINNSGRVAIGISTVSSNYKTSIYNSNDYQLELNCASGQQYTTLGFSNNSVNKSSIFWDNTNSRLDINSNSGYTYFPTNISIGTSIVAGFQLLSQGRIGVNGHSPINIGQLIGKWSSSGYWGFGSKDTATSTVLFSSFNSDGTKLASPKANLELQNNLQVDGSISIGTTNISSYKLAVNGKIHCTEVKVEATPWADYVFQKDYKLYDISELAQFIYKNNHLPGIPTADEINKNGINLGEMQTKLLEKIEELSLYIIELKNDNIRLNGEVEKIKSSMSK